MKLQKNLLDSGKQTNRPAYLHHKPYAVFFGVQQGCSAFACIIAAWEVGVCRWLGKTVIYTLHCSNDNMILLYKGPVCCIRWDRLLSQRLVYGWKCYKKSCFLKMNMDKPERLSYIMKSFKNHLIANIDFPHGTNSCSALVSSIICFMHVLLYVLLNNTYM